MDYAYNQKYREILEGKSEVDISTLSKELSNIQKAVIGKYKEAEKQSKSDPQSSAELSAFADGMGYVVDLIRDLIK